MLKANDIFPGIKVDTGLQPLPGGNPIETWYVHAFTKPACIHMYIYVLVYD
jgi:hypothetical protein